MATATLIGSDPAHTRWCRTTAKKCIEDARRQLGAGWSLFTRDARKAFVTDKVLGIVACQDNELAPLWRMQELVHVTMREFDEGES